MPFRKDYIRYTTAKVKTTFDDKWTERLLVITREQILNTSSSGIGAGSSLKSRFASQSSRNFLGLGDSNNNSNNNYCVDAVEIYRMKDEPIIKMAIAEYEHSHQPNSNNHSNLTKNSTLHTTHTLPAAGLHSTSGTSGKLISSLQPKSKSILHRDIKLMSARDLTNRNNTIILFFEKPLYLNFKTESTYVEWFEILSKIIGSEESSVKEGIGAIIESITDACVVSDADGIITALNTQAEKLFGFSREELLDHNVNVSVLMPDSYAKYHQQILNRYNKHRNRTIIGKPRNLLAKHKLGHKMPIIINVGEVQDSNPQSKYRYIAMFRDSMWRALSNSYSASSSADSNTPGSANTPGDQNSSAESSSPLSSSAGGAASLLPNVAMDPSFHDTHKSAEKLKIQIQKRTKSEIGKFEEESLRMVEDLLKMLHSVTSTINILETEKERLEMLYTELEEKSIQTENELKKAQTSQIYQIYRKLYDNFLHIDKLTNCAQDQLSIDCISCWKHIQMFKKATNAFNQQLKFKNLLSHSGEMTKRARTHTVLMNSSSQSTNTNSTTASQLENMFSNITKSEIIALAVQLFDKFLINYEKGEEPISSKHVNTSHSSQVIAVVTPEVLPVIKNALIKWWNSSNATANSTAVVDQQSFSLSPEVFYFVEKDILEFLKNDN